jgi:hypothetical protein
MTGNKGGTMFYIIAIIAAIFAMPASAQSLKEQLVGAWTLTSCNASLPWCAKPGGMMILDPSGYYIIFHVGLDRPRVVQAGRARDAIPAEEYKAIATALQANFGTWSVDEATKTFTWHIEGGFFTGTPANGNDFKGTISLTGDELKLLPNQTWQRRH